MLPRDYMARNDKKLSDLMWSQTSNSTSPNFNSTPELMVVWCGGASYFAPFRHSTPHSISSSRQSRPSAPPGHNNTPHSDANSRQK
ncbi:unnamed protein product [Arctia plantaginis]|uniref:Uncharacterized protein n=1 Tax=Arctia plantaginis TaxID=874455 RepID=A0A8S0ZY01_ARCPL|nr:unnamed protein product [Arctia plantaginis]